MKRQGRIIPFGLKAAVGYTEYKKQQDLDNTVTHKIVTVFVHFSVISEYTFIQ